MKNVKSSKYTLYIYIWTYKSINYADHKMLFLFVFFVTHSIKMVINLFQSQSIWLINS